MQIDAANNQNFSFSYTTTSGKSLSLAMYDNASASYSGESGSGTLSLRREYGFSFSYSGSQLTNSDLAEIKDAMKDIEPLLTDFLDNSKVAQLDPQDFIQSAMDIAGLLPTPSSENTLNATADSLLSKFDELLSERQSASNAENKAMLEDSKKLFEDILTRLKKQMQEMLQSAENSSSAEKENGLNLLA